MFVTEHDAEVVILRLAKALEISIGPIEGASYNGRSWIRWCLHFWVSS
jgi:hypothetical protein